MSSEEACPGPCNRRFREARDAHRQALADYDPLDSSQSRPEPPEVVPWPGDPVWCGACASSIRERLVQLDDLIALRKAPADGQKQSDAAERVSGSSDEAQSPSQAGDDEDELASMLISWERVYRNLRRWPSPPPRGELASAETTCIAWLMHHLNGVLRSGVAADFGLEILQWHREFTGSTKAGVRTVRKPLRCPSCKYATLIWTEGEQQVTCANPVCNRILSLAEYDAEVERLAAEQKRVALLAGGQLHGLTCLPDSHVRRRPASTTGPRIPGAFFMPGGGCLDAPTFDMDALITATQAAEYAHVSVPAICNWRDRGYLPVATDKNGREIRDSRGRPKYRLRDVARADIETRQRGERMANGARRQDIAA
jgi:hypothetical protein